MDLQKRVADFGRFGSAIFSGQAFRSGALEVTFPDSVFRAESEKLCFKA
jgi:hypothetical protein